MKKLFLLGVLFSLTVSVLKGQINMLHGKVSSQSGNTKEVLAGANLLWKGTQLGTISDVNGNFSLQRTPFTDTLVVSYISYQTLQIKVLPTQQGLNLHLTAGTEIEGATISIRQKTTTVSHFDLMKSENLGEHELGKAACCNLSESFETTPNVDVSVTDAVTGTRQIQLLGLAGPYSLMTKENIPDIRGLSAIFGMGFIPGTWIKSIQLIQGTGSVANGFESIAGQINTELEKPQSTDKVLFNLYFNSELSSEMNLHFRLPISKQWKSSWLIHAKYNFMKQDQNHDGFVDMPLQKNMALMNRYEWENSRNLHFEFGGRLVVQNAQGGQMSFEKGQLIDTLHPWGMTQEIRKIDGWLKLGKVNKIKPWQSSAIQLAGGVFDLNSGYGLLTYQGHQNNIYLNFIHLNRIVNEKNEIKAGFSFQYDQYQEKLNSQNFSREEIVAGTYAEYTFKPTSKVGVVGGLRADYHNQYQWFYTGRLHVRYELFKRTVLRASVGNGLRTANILAEHQSVFASSRSIIIHQDGSNYGYGLRPERALNYGINLTQTFTLDYREGRVSAAFYRTQFVDQSVFDMDVSRHEVHFYNLQGQSYSNSFQVQLDYEIIPRLDVRLAYRIYDVKTSYAMALLQQPLLSRQRGFLNLAYSSRKHWKFDVTLNLQGEKRLPLSLDEHAVESSYHQSPAYALVNAHISKNWNQKWEVYVGGENLTNYTQSSPIVSADKPYGDDFDASIIWGPIFGVKVYVGLKFKLL